MQNAKWIISTVVVLWISSGSSPSSGAPTSKLLRATCWTKPIPDAPEYCKANPCRISGDFDGDGRRDVAEQVAETHGKRRRGVRVTFATGRVSVLGAGVTIGHGGDDFDWMDAWRVMSPDEWKEIWQAPKPAGDVLLVESYGNASGLIGWVEGQPRWEQGDD
jgi:hypothetical protein